MQTVLHHIRIFAHEHDDIPAFHAAYLVGTFLAAAIFNLGFFLVLIAAHMCLDIIKYRDLHGFGWLLTARAVIYENIVDIALFLLALTFAVYLHHTFAVIAVSGLVRSEFTIIRGLGTILPKMGIVEHTFGILLNFHAYLYSLHPDLKQPIARVHRWSSITVIICLILLGLAVVLYQGHLIDLGSVLRNELELKL
jgi:hypothetical protein